jgi:hypothetical protein
LKIHPIKYFFAAEEIKLDLSKQFKEFEKISISFDFFLSLFNLKAIFNSVELEFTTPKLKIPKIRSINNSNLDSSLILMCKKHRDQINQWISSLQCSLLWRGSRDGFSSSVFHERCDNKGATLTIIKSSDGYIFGGYLSVSWNSSGKYISDSQAWIFSLNLPLINIAKFKCKLPGYAAWGTSGNCPVFGGGHDIIVASDSNRNSKSYLMLGHSYDTSAQLYDSKFLNGSGKSGQISVSEIEVYQLSS